ncbi:MFS transporter [Bacillus solimangrovi]|uniref:Multidrug MFS transporter n=1 Tax=Bacillus solimangrovi TaxID=1305675 RepID=A0A1E5LGR3_9BACI|nr:MFS transporter [Bacillus solimangrovi]OEH93263.1 multidrug MFS transporter [Bacillus solimangrovi]
MHTENNLQLTDGQKNRLIILICTILAFSVMNGTMFNVAIPDIAETFNLLPSEVSWVLTGYILIFAIGSLIYGKLADIYPIRTLITIGISLFSTGALIGFLSPNYGTLIIARILQALGGAAFPALSFLIPARFLPEQRGRVFGIVSSTVAFASGVGPILGGVIGSTFNWRFLFLFSVAAALAIPLFRKWLPLEEKREGTIDFLGAGLLAAMISSLLFFITSFLWYTALLFFIFSLLFIWRTMKAKHPFIEPEILKNMKYTTTVLTSFLGTFVLFGLIFIIPIMLRNLYGLSTLQIGLVLFPGAMAAGLIGQSGGRIIDSKGGALVVKVALILIGAGSLLISTFTGYAAWVIAPCLLISYLGFPLIQSATADLLSSVLPDEQNGVGIGLFNLLNFVAGAFSSAIFGSILDLNSAHIQFNPFAPAGDSILYSNLYIVLSLFAFLGLTVFTLMFTRNEQRQSTETPISYN